MRGSASRILTGVFAALFAFLIGFQIGMAVYMLSPLGILIPTEVFAGAFPRLRAFFFRLRKAICFTI